MRVLQVTSYFYPHIGGLEHYVYNLSKNLVEKGHEVVVCTSNIPESMRYETVDGMEIRRFRSLAEPLGNPLTPGMLKSLVQVKGFDIVSSQGSNVR